MGIENDLDAQDPNLSDTGNEVDQDVEVDDGEEKPVGEGVKKRIGELTAKTHEYQRQLEAANQRLIEATARAAAAEARGVRNEPPPVDLDDKYKDLDPQQRAFAKELVAGVRAEMQGQMQRLQYSHEIDLMSRDAEATLQKMGHDTPELRAEARKYVAGLRAKGIPINGEDAAVYAAGRALMEGKIKVSAPPNNGGSYKPATIGGVRQPVINNTTTAKPLPSNFNDLDHDKQIELLTKRGAGDIPL